jgi:thioredoxin 1
MTDDPETEREAIRNRKRERLRRRLDGKPDDDPTDRAPRAPVHVESSDDLETLASDHEVLLVDFYADWCGPCEMLEPVVESIADDGTAVVAKVDVDEHQSLAAEAGVRGVPTLVLYVDGSPAERLVGMQEENRLRSVIDRHAA